MPSAHCGRGRERHRSASTFADPQRKTIALVATAHYLVRVMWAVLKRGNFLAGEPGLD
jgi:hypothetical protein